MDLLNKVMVVGNLTRDPKVRELGKDKTLAELSLAVRQTGGGGAGRDGVAADPIFLDVVVWDRAAENASQYLSKGSSVLIEGRLKMDTWQDKETGKTRRKLMIAGERMRFMNFGGTRDERGSDDHGQREESLRGRREPAGSRR